MKKITIELDDDVYKSIEDLSKSENISFNDAVDMALWGFILNEAVLKNRIREKNLEIMSAVVT